MADELALVRQLLEADPTPDDPGLANIVKAQLFVEAPLARAGATPVRVPRQRGRRTWRRGLVAVIGGVAAGVLAIAVPIATHHSGNSPSNEGPTLRLASYSLQLPAAYNDVSSEPRYCRRAFPMFAFVPKPGGVPPAMVTQPNEPAIASAVDQAGGCLVMALAGPYPPADPDTPWMMLKPQEARLLEVDGYQGWDGYPRVAIPVPVRSHAVVSAGVLDLTVPASGGQVEQLAIVAVGISPAQLVAIVSTGLTVPTVSPAPATTRGPVAATTSVPSATTTVPAATSTVPAASTTVPSLTSVPRGTSRD